MEYIRRQKMLPDHDPNTRHCLYGLDADLIMLALVSHEPHFALLREEVHCQHFSFLLYKDRYLLTLLITYQVTFGRKKRKSDEPAKFQLLYINLLREYLDEEFKMDLPFGYDKERVIDDFILMCFFVGTNKLIPSLHIIILSSHLNSWESLLWFQAMISCHSCLILT